MTSNTSLTTSLISLTRILKAAFKLDQRRHLRMPAEGSLHLLFQSQEGSVSSDSATLHDTFPGGLAFRSPRLFCVGSHVCLSDGIEAMEVSIEYRREDGAAFVYVVSVGEPQSLPAAWRPRLPVLANQLVEILARCQVHGEEAVDAR